MPIFNKGLSELIKNLLAKVEEREEKIRKKITEYEAKASNLQASINTENSNLVQFQLDEDAQGEERCQKNLKKLRDELVCIEDLIKAYRGELERKHFVEADMKKIHAAALKEKENRLNKKRELLETIKKTEAKIEELERELKKLRSDYSFEGRTETDELERVIKFIDPRAAKLYHYDKKRFLEHWLKGEDTEHLFKKPEEWRGMVVTERYVETDEKGHEKINERVSTYR